MSERKYIKAQVVKSRLLDEHEKSLLEEFKALQMDSIKQLRESMQHIITLSTASIGVQITLIQLASYTIIQPLTLIDFLLLFSFLLLFFSVLVAVFGQISHKLNISNLNTITKYRRYRENMIRNGYRFYVTANLLFITGLAISIVNSFVLLVQ